MKRFTVFLALIVVFVALFSGFIVAEADTVVGTADKLFVSEDFDYSPGSVYNPLNSPRTYSGGTGW